MANRNKDRFQSKSDKRSWYKHIAEDTLKTMKASPRVTSVDESIHYVPNETSLVLLGNPINAVTVPTYKRPTNSDSTGTTSLQISVVLDTTLVAARNLHEKGVSPCALNFASARNPGGGWIRGANAQEENLCRASYLFSCIEQSPIYKLCRKDKNRCLYHDAAIFSPDVLVFKTERGELLRGDAFEVSFITCPAPNSGQAKQWGVDTATIDQTLEARTRTYLAVAAANEQKHLILGSWGCGVFGNDVEKVAAVCVRLLRTEFKDAFTSVTFAVIDPEHARVFNKYTTDRG
eukprot:m.113423 g.113423  ORF g.113423 m.113423 type:complete len:290 (-) comp28269_c1_seq1:267-1136(-)